MEDKTHGGSGKTRKSFGGSSGDWSGEDEAEESVSSFCNSETDWSPSSARTSAESCFRREWMMTERCFIGGGGLGKEDGGEESRSLNELKDPCRLLIPLEEGVEAYSRIETASSQLSSESYRVDLRLLNRTLISFVDGEEHAEKGMARGGDGAGRGVIAWGGRVRRRGERSRSPVKTRETPLLAIRSRGQKRAGSVSR